MSKVSLDSQTVENYQKLIAHEVWSYINKTANNNLKADDMIQDLWVEILEYQYKYGKLPDYALAKKICQNSLVDMTRKGLHRNALSLDADEEGDRASWNVDTKGITDIVSEVELDELADMFEKGTPERTYIDFYLEKASLRDTGVTPEETRQQGGYTDSALAKMLGYKGTGDRGWKVFSRKMKEIISDYYGRK